MSALLNCGICCMLVSIWGVLQLFFMGLFYTLEASVLIEDVHAHKYDDYKDFIEKTKKNYSIVSINCFVAAAVYMVLIVISYFCIHKARKAAMAEAKLKEDDELSCTPRTPIGKMILD